MSLFGPNISKMEAQRDINGLIKVVNGKDAKNRQLAVEALGRLKGPAVLSYLLALLPTESDEAVLTRVLTAIDACGWKPGTDADAAWYYALKGNLQACAACGAAGVRPLIVQLARNNPDPNLPRLLASIGAPAFDPLVEYALNLTATYLLHIQFAQGSGNPDDSRASLKRQAATIRQCMYAIAYFGTMPAYHKLGAMYNLVSEGVPAFPDELPDLFEALALRCAAIGALQCCPLPASLQLLAVIHSTDPSPRVRSCALQAMQTLVTQHPGMDAGLPQVRLALEGAG